MNWNGIGWCASGLLVGGVTAPLIIWWPQISSTTPIGHGGRAPPAAEQPAPAAVAILVPVQPPQPEIHSVPWFVEHESAIAPRRADCANNAPASMAAAAECGNADRASLHVFNQQLRAKYFGGK
ncbi:MAG TPA: hypothetical protein VGM38_02535 [Pseudolysinimonas sp.]|jgi:hypothetical protein